MPPHIDMNIIKEAMQRRMSGEIPVTPAVQQMTPPTGATPVGGQNTPVQTPPQSPPTPSQIGQSTMAQRGGGGAPPTGSAPAGVPSAETQKAAQAAQVANGPQFDDETRVTAKALVQKLLKVL